MRNDGLRKGIARVSFAITAGLVLGAPAVSVAQAQSTIEIDSGHVDAFNVVSEKPGHLELNLKEDVTGAHQHRAPETVTLKVKGEAYNDATTGVEQIGKPTYYLPQTQDQNLLWPGWDTLEAQNNYRSIDINFTEVCGPGRIWLLGSGSFGDIQSLLGNGDVLNSGNVRHQEFPAHTHAHWAFERPGTYQIKAQAVSADEDTKGDASNEATYTFVVEPSDSDPDKDQSVEGANACAGASADTPSEPGAVTPSNPPANNSLPPAQTNKGGTGTTGTTSTTGTTGTSGAANTAKKTSTTSSSTNGSSTNNFAGQPAEGDKPAATCAPGLHALIKDDRNQPAQWVAPNSLSFNLGEKAKANLPQALGPVPAGSAYMIGSTQQPGVPWLGANTMHPDLLNNINGDVTFSLTSFEGPGSMYVFEQGNLGKLVGTEWFKASPGQPSGSHVIPRNSHVHPNWVFSKPGTYKVGITQTATLKDGTKASAPATLTFNVGSNASGGVNEGHFDFGSAVTQDCTGGAEGGNGGAGADGGASQASTGSSGSSSGSLANTGANGGILSILLAGLGLAVLGSGLLFWLRSTNISL